MMRNVTGIARMGLATFALLLGCQAQAHEATMVEARQLYDEGRWSAAWDLLAALADRGDADAARLAIRMTRFGPQLFQQTWAPAPDRLVRWRGVATGERAVRTADSD